MNMDIWFLCALKYYSFGFFQPFKNENAFLLMGYPKTGVELTWPSGPRLLTPDLKQSCPDCFFIVTSSVKFTPCIPTSIQRGHPVSVFKQYIELILIKCFLYARPGVKGFGYVTSFIPLHNLKSGFHHYLHFIDEETKRG